MICGRFKIGNWDRDRALEKDRYLAIAKTNGTSTFNFSSF